MELVLLRCLGLKILLLLLYHHLFPVFNLVIEPLDVFLPKFVEDLLPQFVPVQVSAADELVLVGHLNGQIVRHKRPS